MKITLRLNHRATEVHKSRLALSAPCCQNPRAGGIELGKCGASSGCLVCLNCSVKSENLKGKQTAILFGKLQVWRVLQPEKAGGKREGESKRLEKESSPQWGALHAGLGS